MRTDISPTTHASFIAGLEIAPEPLCAPLLLFQPCTYAWQPFLPPQPQVGPLPEVSQSPLYPTETLKQSDLCFRVRAP